MKLDFFNIITIVNLFIVVLLTLFFWINKKGQKLSNRILSFLLFLFLLQIIHSFTTSNFTYILFLDYHKEIFLIWITAFLIGPVIYYYVKHVIQQNTKIKATDLLHTIPFLLMVSYSIYQFTLFDKFIIWNSNGFNRITIFLILIHNLIYIILTINMGMKNNLRLKSFINELKQSNIAAWLQFFLLGFIALWVVKVYIFASIMVINKTSWCAFTNSIYALTLFGFVSTLLFLLLLKPEIYLLKEKYKNHKLTSDERLKYMAFFEQYMKETKPYKNPEISLETLAGDIKIPDRIVSQIINESFHCTFKSYINQYRINECIQRLSDPDSMGIPIKEIMYEVGFTSKSAFNNAFKKSTGLSPLEFRKNILVAPCN